MVCEFLAAHHVLLYVCSGCVSQNSQTIADVLNTRELEFHWLGANCANSMGSA